MALAIVLTNAGKAWLASALNGVSNPPVYLVLENNGTTFSQTCAPGVTSITVGGQAHQVGDTQLILGVGLPTQETVTFTAYSAGVYTLSAATTQGHTSGDPICRVPLVTDLMSNVQSEIQYDSANDPNQRLQSVSGYASGTNQWTTQFFLPGTEASSFLMMGGIADNPTIGQGNLYGHFALGTNHVYTSGAGVDLEIDIPLTIS